MASLDKVVFDPKWKAIVRRVENNLNVVNQPKVSIVTEIPVMKGTNEDPQLMVSNGVATA